MSRPARLTPSPAAPSSPELLLQVLSYYTHAAHSRDPTTIRTLQALSCTCKLLHFQALKVRYEVLLLHRHVRDFRTWFRKLNEGRPPFVCAGISRAIFSGLDDVSEVAKLARAVYIHKLRSRDCLPNTGWASSGQRGGIAAVMPPRHWAHGTGKAEA